AARKRRDSGGRGASVGVITCGGDIVVVRIEQAFVCERRLRRNDKRQWCRYAQGEREEGGAAAQYSKLFHGQSSPVGRPTEGPASTELGLTRAHFGSTPSRACRCASGYFIALTGAINEQQVRPRPVPHNPPPPPTGRRRTRGYAPR